MVSTQIKLNDSLALDNLYAKPAALHGMQEKTLDIRLVFSARTSQRLFLLQQTMKRLLDIVLASVGILMLVPVFLAIALLIKTTSPGPVLYKSLRIGKNYAPFHMFKFRTMQVDADALRDQLRKQARLEGNLFKLHNDPRVTPVGKLLRATSLDELPQLFNVVLGNMSLVGPRPLPPDESDLFEEPYTLRYKVTPGITGIWQVSGRSKLSFDSLCKLELSYVMDWSLWKDLSILAKTVPVVLQKTGAY